MGEVWGGFGNGKVIQIMHAVQISMQFRYQCSSDLQIIDDPVRLPLWLSCAISLQCQSKPPSLACNRGLSLDPRFSTPPVSDYLQYAKTEGEGLGNFIT